MAIFALISTLISLVIFAVVGSLGSGQHKSRSDLFSTPSLLNASQVARTTLAANIAIAGGVEWFLIRGGSTSLWIVIWGPLMVSVGLYLNAIFVDKFAPQEIFDEYSSMSTLTKIIFRSRFVSFLILSVTGMGSLTILIVEIYVGASLVKVFFPSASIPHESIIFCLIFVITFYATIGGLSGIVRNDSVQNFFITSLLVVFVIFLINIRSDVFQNSASLPFSPEAFNETSFPLIVWLIFVNFTFIPTQLRFWQVAGSSRDRSSFVSGVKISAVQTGILWSVIALTGYIITLQTGKTFLSLSELMGFLLAEKNNVASQFAFVVISLAAFAALVSTADSSLISISQLISDNFFSRYESAFVGRIIIVVVSFFIFIFYSIVFRVFDGNAVLSVFLSAFSLFILTAPMLAIGMINRELASTPIFRLCGVAGLLSALFIVLVGSYSDLNFPEWAGSIGIVFSALGVAIGYVLARKA